jgi:hypothetical protein
MALNGAPLISGSSTRRFSASVSICGGGVDLLQVLGMKNEKAEAAIGFNGLPVALVLGARRCCP